VKRRNFWVSCFPR